MPDNMTIVFLITAVSFGGIIGFFIGVLIAKKKNKEALQKTWIPGKKSLIEIGKIEKALLRYSPEEGSLELQITPEEMEEKLSGAYNRLIKIRETLKKYSQPDKAELHKDNSSGLAVEEKTVQTIDVFTEPTSTSSTESNFDVTHSEPLSDKVQFERVESVDITPKSLSSQITNLYNRGINEKSERDLFWETFSITRISNANAVAQRIGEVSAPAFREADNGDFLAIANDNKNYFVVPLFDTLITSSAFNENGIGYAFDCLNYDSHSAGAIARVNKAAVFRRDGEQWFLLDGGKGELVLQN